MDQNLTLGEVINGTITTIAENKEAALAYVAVLTVIGTAIELGLGQLGRDMLDQFANAGTDLLGALGRGPGIPDR